MTNKNQKIKAEELTRSMDIINKYINTSNVLKTLNNLGIISVAAASNAYDETGGYLSTYPSDPFSYITNHSYQGISTLSAGYS
jgi:hypothetical protein